MWYTDSNNNGNIYTYPEENMAFKKTFSYLNDTDQQKIESLCRVIRRSEASRKNLYYIVANFGEFLEDSVFVADSSDADRYITHLKNEILVGHLKEHYCACIFFELRTFFDHAANQELVYENPFSGTDNPFSFPDKLKSADLPKLSDVDKLLGLCYGETECLVAVLLAFRMGLTTSEIAVLEKKQFCLNEKDGDVYLKMWRWADGLKKELFLLVPRDIVPHIRAQILATPSDYEFVFRSRKTKKPPTVRALQYRLDNIQEECETKIQFSQLRSLYLYLLLIEKVPVNDICRYAGIKGDWLSRYDDIPEALIADASKYINIRIV